MRGANAVRDQLALLLASEMPRKIPLLRQAWDRDASQLPDVDQFVSGDVPDEVINGGQGGAWVIVVNPRLLRMTRTGDFSPAGEPEFHCRYVCRIFVWARGANVELSQECRDNLAAAARLCIVQYPTLTNDGTLLNYRVNEGTYTEDFGMPVRVNGSKAWSAAILSVEIDAEEFVDDGSTLPPLGEVETVQADTYAVGPQVPFPPD